MKRRVLTAVLSTVLLFTACSGAGDTGNINSKQDINVVDDKFRTTYEVFVYSFADSNGDGIGDLAGLDEKLDYINDGKYGEGDDLEANEIWLMPICPSPSYHKYDVTDYTDIDPAYGTMSDFENLISDCHERGIRVILDLVMNHSSSDHPWFKEAAKYMRSLPENAEPDESECPYVKYYNFSRLGLNGYAKLPDSEWYYEARFVDTMPDLNLSNPAVRQEFADITSFWMKKGADGFRLDAVTSYYTGDDESNIEVLTWLADTVHGVNPDAYIVGEAWTNSTIYGKYYQSGVDSFFDFDGADSEGDITSVVTGQKSAKSYGLGLVDRESRISESSASAINAPFISNHDMGRAAGYFTGDDGTLTKMAGGVYLMSSGNAFIYYGEELGMKGSGKDENKRAPMQWSEESDNGFMTYGPPAMESVKMKFPAMDQQLADENSILNYYREAIRVRNNFPVIARGRSEVDEALSDDDILVMTKSADDYDDVTLVFNFSDEEKNIDMSSKDLTKIVGSLYASSSDTGKESEQQTVSAPSLKGGKLTISPHTILVLE